MDAGLKVPHEFATRRGLLIGRSCMRRCRGPMTSGSTNSRPSVALWCAVRRFRRECFCSSRGSQPQAFASAQDQYRVVVEDLDVVTVVQPKVLRNGFPPLWVIAVTGSVLEVRPLTDGVSLPKPIDRHECAGLSRSHLHEALSPTEALIRRELSPPRVLRPEHHGTRVAPNVTTDQRDALPKGNHAFACFAGPLAPRHAAKRKQAMEWAKQYAKGWTHKPTR
jgi:hypothetical protein